MGWFQYDTNDICLALAVDYRLNNLCVISGGATGAGGANAPPPMIYDTFFFWLLVSSAVGHGHDSTPTPLWKYFRKNFEVGEKKCAPSLSDFFKAGANFMARAAAVARHFGNFAPPPKQTPWRRPCA